MTLPLAMNGLLVTMYADEAWWVLTMALEAAFDGDGSQLMWLSDIYLDRDDLEGYTTNSMVAFIAIGCLDSRSPADWDSVEAAAQALAEAAPTFGQFWGYGEKMCDLWPYPQVGEPRIMTASGADPILVIGTTGDPATPYEWAEALADQLESGVLVTYQGNGHTAYGRSNSCISNAVDAFFVDGTVPPEGLTC
ncbi:MAG: alpha/beta hydrolase [Micrococcales bacterium]|nr:alpha/beta hydrolase [Micrococcales bacterium]